MHQTVLQAISNIITNVLHGYSELLSLHSPHLTKELNRTGITVPTAYQYTGLFCSSYLFHKFSNAVHKIIRLQSIFDGTQLLSFHISFNVHTYKKRWHCMMWSFWIFAIQFYYTKCHKQQYSCKLSLMISTFFLHIGSILH